MADLVYKVSVDTAQAQKSLDNLNKSIGGLRSALAGLAIGAFITNTYRSAQAAKDLSDQTGLAVQSIIGLRKAFQESGSSAEAADNALLKLAKNIGDAKTGNDELAIAFQNLGVNVYDATATIDEQALKVVEGLGRIKDQSVQTSTAVQLLGKNGAAAFSQIGASARGYVAGSLEAANATIEADAAAEKFQQAVTNIQTELLKVLVPLNKFIADLKLSGENIKDFVERAAAIGGLILTFTALGKIIQGLRFAFGLLSGSMAAIVTVGKGIGRTAEIIYYYFQRLFGLIVKKPKTTIFEGFTTQFPILAKQLAQLTGALGIFGGVLAGAFSLFDPAPVLNGFKKLGEYLGIVKTEQEKLADAEKKAAADKAEADKKQADIDAANLATLKQKIEAIKEIGNAYAKANEQVLLNLDNELKYIKMSDRKAEVEKAVDSVRENQRETVKKLQKELEKLPEGEKQRRAALEETIAAVNRDTEATVKGVRQKIEALQQERDAIEARNRAIELREQVRQDTTNLKAMQDEIDMLYMTNDQREEYRRKLEAEKNLKERLAAIDLEQERLGKNVTASQIADFEARKKAATDYYNAVLEKNKELQAAQEDEARKIKVWGEETKKALEDSISPSSQVKTFWDGLSGQIDNFTKTGKFKVKEFLAGIIQDFIAAKLKLAALDFLKSIGLGGGGGLLGGAIIPGFLAGGGNAEQGKPYVVGEKGPELFVPPTAGRVVPNHALSSGAVSAPVTNNYITNNISALDAKSVAELFAQNRKTLLGTVKLAEKELPYMA